MMRTRMSALVALLMILLTALQALAAPPDSPALEGVDTPGVLHDVLPLEEGMLVLGTSESGEDGWMARVDDNGAREWIIRDAGSGVYSFPEALGCGMFYVLVTRPGQTGHDATRTGTGASLLAVIDSGGASTELIPLPGNTQGLLRRTGGFFAVGYAPGRGRTAWGRPGRR